MQITTIASITILAASVQAQTPAELAAQIPACAIACDVAAIAAVGCDITDYACHCARSAEIVPLSSPCLMTNSTCTVDDLTTLVGLTSKICSILDISATALSSTVTPAPTAAVSQVSDGQIQATSIATVVAVSSASVISQISDGQIQATSIATLTPVAPVPIVSQVSDGQIQATGTGSITVKASASPSPSVLPFEGVASRSVLGGGSLVVAGAIAALCWFL